MKKRIILLIIGILIMNPICVKATNYIYSIDMDIYVDSNGNAKITEVWDVDGDDGTEWYKTMYNIGNSVITNYKVSIDGQELKLKVWNVKKHLTTRRVIME